MGRQRNHAATLVMPLVERPVEPRDGLLRDGDGHDELVPLPSRNDVIASRLILGWFVNKHRHPRMVQFRSPNSPTRQVDEAASNLSRGLKQISKRTFTEIGCAI